MNTIERRQYDMLVRIRDFGDRYGDLFPASSVARQKFATVAAAVAELDAQALAHMAASMSARAPRKTMARAALLARLQAVSQTARVLAADAPGLDQQFHLPHKPTDQTLLTAGRKFARDAEPLSSRFVLHGMPVTYIADVHALVDGFERALRDRGVALEARYAARASAKAALLSGLAAVRSLDAIVTNHMHDDAVTRTVWKSDRRIVYPARAPRTAAMPEPAPAAVAPEPATGRQAAFHEGRNRKARLLFREPLNAGSASTRDGAERPQDVERVRRDDIISPDDLREAARKLDVQRRVPGVHVMRDARQRIRRRIDATRRSRASGGEVFNRMDTRSASPAAIVRNSDINPD